MSDKSEQMKPIPDGGLKEAMPSWLKRPPAWRDLPSVEERHERTLPDPDTSTIDPHSLVDVSDLPQWLQAIAARSNEPEAADEVAESVADAGVEPAPVEASPEFPETSVATDPEPIPTEPEPVVAATESAPMPAQEHATTGTPMWLIPVALILSLALLIVLIYVI